MVAGAAELTPTAKVAHAMKFSLGLPPAAQFGDEFVSGRAITEMAQHAEAVGFDAVYVTDHPAGDHKWLESGGHHALDPFVALSFAAAATTTLRVQTHVLVLGYRNPFLAAKSILSLDVLSDGRFTVGVAAGYLRSEFNALGIDYDERNALADEAIDVIKLALTQDAVEYEGLHFRSRGTTMAPRPKQTPHPPIWVGGNSNAAARRAVERAQGWCPFPNSEATSKATKTPKLETVDDLAQRIDYARQHADAIGRTEPFDICFAPTSMTQFAQADYDATHLRDEVKQLEALGVTWMPVEQFAPTRAEWMTKVDALAAVLME